MNKPNPIFLCFAAFSLGSLAGFLISSISTKSVEEPINRLQIALELTLFLLILCIIVGGILLAFV